MTLRRQVDDTINSLHLYQLVKRIEIADVHLHELVIRLTLYILQVRQVTSISQLVKVDDVIFRVLVHEKTNHVTTDETRTSRDTIFLFANNFLLIFSY